MTKVFDSLPVCVQFDTFKSSCLQIFFKIGVPKNFAIFTGKHRSEGLQLY